MFRLLVVVAAALVGACSPSAAARVTPEEEAYVSKLQLSNVRREMRPVDGCVVSGEIRNTGDRPVASARVKALFLDKSGTPIGERHYLPVKAEGLPAAIPTDGQVLQPGYAKVWREPCPGDITADWSGQVTATVETVGFPEAE